MKIFGSVVHFWEFFTIFHDSSIFLSFQSKYQKKWWKAKNSKKLKLKNTKLGLLLLRKALAVLLVLTNLQNPQRQFGRPCAGWSSIMTSPSRLGYSTLGANRQLAVHPMMASAPRLWISSDSLYFLQMAMAERSFNGGTFLLFWISPAMGSPELILALCFLTLLIIFSQNSLSASLSPSLGSWMSDKNSSHWSNHLFCLKASFFHRYSLNSRQSKFKIFF